MSFNKFDKHELLTRFLDGDLSPEDERKALHLIAEDNELRSMLRFDRLLSDSLRDHDGLDSFSVPDDFTDDVMSKIEELEQSKQESTSEITWTESLLQHINSWFTPREYTFRPAIVFALPAILLIAFAGLFQADIQQADTGSEFTQGTELISDSRSVSDEVWIRFIYIDEDAEQIAVAGDFSDWNPVEMTSQEMNGKKVWTGLISVERGEHHYMFVKDGEEWISDPLAEVQRDDGFGNKNAVIYL